MSLLRRTAVPLLLTAVAFATYAPALDASFVFDDTKIVVENPTIRSFGNLPRILADTFRYRPIRRGGILVDPSYRPVRFVSHTVDYQIFGLRPAGHHASNLLYHAMAAYLLFLVLRRLRFGAGASLLGALLFLVHPINSEPACYVTGRKDLLCAALFFAAMLVWFSYRLRPGRRRAAALVLLYVLALFSKEAAIVLPAALLLYETAKVGLGSGFVARLRRHLLRRRLLVPLVILFVIGAAFGLFKMFVKSPATAGELWSGFWGGSRWTAFLSVSRAFAHYIRLLLIPYPLSADYSYAAFRPSEGILSPPATLFCLLLHVFLIAAALRLLRRRHPAGFGILLFYVALLPVSQIVPVPERMAERFVYIAVAGAVVIFVWAVSRRRRALWLGAAAVLALAPVSFARSYAWRNQLTLFESVLEHYPDCARAHMVVGGEYLKRGETSRALAHLERVETILAGRRGALWRGIVLLSRQQRAKALVALGRLREARHVLAALLAEKDVFGRPVATTPEFSNIHYDFSGVLLELGEYTAAAEMAEQAAALAAVSGEESFGVRVMSLYRAGLAHAAARRFGRAASVLEEAARLARGRDQRIGILHFLGLVLRDAGEHERAAAVFCECRRQAEAYLRTPEKFARLTARPFGRGSALRARKQSLLLEADAMAVLERFTEARDLCERYRALWPLEADGHIAAARVAFRTDGSDAAVRLLDEAARSLTGKEREKVLREAIRFKAARKPTEDVAKRIESLVRTAKKLLGARPEEAKELLEKALRLSSKMGAGERRGWLRLAEARIILLERAAGPPPRDALEEARRLLSTADECGAAGGERAALWVRLARLLRDSGEAKSAADAFGRAAALNPEYLGVWWELAAALEAAGRGDEALAALATSAGHGYRVAASHLRRGLILFERRRYAEAEAAFCESLKTAVDGVRDEARWWRARALLALARYKEAGDELRRFLRDAAAEQPHRREAEFFLRSDPRLGGMPK